MIAARLAWLQIVATSTSRRCRTEPHRLVPVPPRAARSSTARGVLLASNLASFLEITPEQVGSHAQMEALLETAQDADRAVGLRINHFRRLLPQPRATTACRCASTSPGMKWRVAINQFRLPGVDIRNDLTRTYPLGTHMAHVVGYVGRIDEQELARLDPGRVLGVRATSARSASSSPTRTCCAAGRLPAGGRPTPRGRVIRVLEARRRPPGATST